MISLEECHCHCHNKSAGLQVKHIAPCCLSCSFCKKKIKSIFLESHEKQCEEIWSNLLRDVKVISEE